MDDLFSLFYDKVYCSGFLQRRIYVEPDGRKPTTIEGRDWRRVYAELKGPLLRCWKASACDADPGMIERLKREALSCTDVELEPIDLRMAILEPLEDYRLERTLFNAFSINYGTGMDNIHFQAPNSTAVKEWKAAIVRASREALLLDQRYSLRIQMGPETPLYSDTALPEIPEIQLKWLGSLRWKKVWLSIEAKRGFLYRHQASSLKMRCIYMYEDETKKRCIGRLSNITAIYAMHSVKGDLNSHDFVIEATGKQKSSSLEGLRATERAWFRVRSHETMIKWIATLRNIFEIVTPSNVLVSAMEAPRDHPEMVLTERQMARSVGTPSVDLSFGSSQSVSTGTPSEPLINRLRRPWDAQYKVRPRTLTTPSERKSSMELLGGIPPNTTPNYSLPPSLASCTAPSLPQISHGNLILPSSLPYPILSSPYGLAHPMSIPSYYHQATPYFPPYMPPPVTPDQSRWISQHELGESCRTTVQRNFFISHIYSLITMKPYSSVSCDDFYRAYERYCLRCAQRPAAPLEVNEWMQEMGFTQLSPRGNEVLSWQHVAFKGGDSQG